MKVRTCRFCGKDETEVEFYPTTTRGPGNACRRCWIDKSVQWKRDNRDRWRQSSHRRNTIKRLSITAEDYDRWFPPDVQCSACGATEGQQRMGKSCLLVLDHDHATGKPRGVLCHPCNMAAGMAGDNPAVLRQLADYLEEVRD